MAYGLSTPGFSNGRVTDPLAYVRFLVGTQAATDWGTVLTGLDPQLSSVGITRQPGSSTYSFNGKSFDVRAPGGATWSWQTPGMQQTFGQQTLREPGSGQDTNPPLPGGRAPTPNAGDASGRAPSSGAMGNAARRAAGLVPPAVPPKPYEDPVSPFQKYLEAIAAAQRARRRGAAGGRASAIYAGFTAGRPTTAPAQLVGS